MDLDRLTLVQTQEKLKNKDFSVKELIEAFIKKAKKESHLNVFITETFDQALKEAVESDQRITKNNPRKLEGLPIGLKDLYCTKGIRTTAGSKILENFVPQYESTISQNLLDEGAISLGKLNMDEFAMGSSNLTSYFGPVISPIKSTKDPEKKMVPGGSSGGPAAAVAAGIVLAAVGSDTGGSVRQPAAFTGTVGVKPTYGLCSRYGMIALASSLDQAGPLTKDVRDSALMLSVMASYDPKDSTSIKAHSNDYLTNLKPSCKGVRIGILKECFENLNPEVLAATQKGIDILKSLGAELVEAHIPTMKYALPAYHVILPAEASSNLARYDGVRFGVRQKDSFSLTLNDMYSQTRKECLGKEVRRRIFIGTYSLSKAGYDSYYQLAQKVRRKIFEDFQNTFQKVDILVTPTTAGAAFGIDEGPNMSAVDMYLNDLFTVSVNMAGLPAISVPVGYTQDNLPLGIQFIGPMLTEQLLFNTATAFEDANSNKIH